MRAIQPFVFPVLRGDESNLIVYAPVPWLHRHSNDPPVQHARFPHTVEDNGQLVGTATNPCHIKTPANPQSSMKAFYMDLRRKEVGDVYHAAADRTNFVSVLSTVARAGCDAVSPGCFS